MPVPGTLKRRPVNEKELADLLESKFKLTQLETLAYLRLLEGIDMTSQEIAHALRIKLDESQALIERMMSSGLIIKGSVSDNTFAPLHPRMTMTNIFKMYEKELVSALRDRRATVDRVVNLLEPIYEERKVRSR